MTPMKLAVVCALALVSNACIPLRPSQRQASWQDVCYKGMANDIDLIVGKDAIDCGFASLGASDTATYLTQRCGMDASASGRPFKFGRCVFGGDGSYCTIALRSPDGQLWSVFVDNWIGSTNPSLSVSRCKSLRFEADDFSFDLDGCVKAQDVVGRIVHKTEAKP
jgi:hypothetical protein